MEQLIVTAVFAICAAACVRILVASYFMATETRDMSNAIVFTESAAECYKAAFGDVGAAARLMGATVRSEDGAALVFYDKEWKESSEHNAEYLLSIVGSQSPDYARNLLTGEIKVEKLSGDVIFSIPIAITVGGIVHG